VLGIEVVLLFDKLRIADPVGATSVHLVNGVFGTLCVRLIGIKGLSGFPNDGPFHGGGFAQGWIQMKGVAAVGAFTFVGNRSARPRGAAARGGLGEGVARSVWNIPTVSRQARPSKLSDRNQ
jgi:hypothetical protein